VAGPRARGPRQEPTMSPMDMRERLQVARNRLGAYEGRLKELEGRLKDIRVQAEQVTGRARVKLKDVERQVRGRIDATLKRVDGVIKTIEPGVKRAIAQTKRVQRGVSAGIKAGAATYRKPLTPRSARDRKP
jgi:BMFP domain-containing protein YqiC